MELAEEKGEGKRGRGESVSIKREGQEEEEKGKRDRWKNETTDEIRVSLVKRDTKLPINF